MLKDLLEKYVKPKSLTWWAGVVPLLAGLVLLVAGGSDFAKQVQELYPNMDALTLINIGLAAIGIRGAINPTAAAPKVDA
jgi:hypothetical protein